MPFSSERGSRCPRVSAQGCRMSSASCRTGCALRLPFLGAPSWLCRPTKRCPQVEVSVFREGIALGGACAKQMEARGVIQGTSGRCHIWRFPSPFLGAWGVAGGGAT